MQKIQCGGNLGAKNSFGCHYIPLLSKSEPVGAKVKLQMHRKELDSNRI
jgi:hypothetical protein